MYARSAIVTWLLRIERRYYKALGEHCRRRIERILKDENKRVHQSITVSLEAEVRTQSPAHAKTRVQRRADSQLLRNIIKALHIGPVLYIQSDVRPYDSNERTNEYIRSYISIIVEIMRAFPDMPRMPRN